MKNLRIIFMGTPEFAVATLGSLLMNGLNVTGVVTVPDKPAGRGRKILKSPVKEFAEFSHLPVLQPANLKDTDFINELKALNADLFVVVAFRMLPEVVWRIPPMGTINLHASLLPHYRGAAPINHAIINGETVTGLTTFLIDNEIDAGKLLLREEVHIFPFENAGDLHDRLMKQGARLVINTISGMATNSLIPTKQSEYLKPGEKPIEAPKIFPGKCLINWTLDPVSIHNLIRGLAPNPCARSFISNKNEKLMVKIFESTPEKEDHNFEPGQIISDGKHFLRISCKGGFVNILSLQLEGKKRMNTIEFLRGFKIAECEKAVI
jgi:methionyl-tRNA formyltransferase